MNYSYTQVSQYLTCPRKYRHRYLDGWQEKDTRAAMLFGRAFEQAIAALFRRINILTQITGGRVCRCVEKQSPEYSLWCSVAFHFRR